MRSSRHDKSKRLAFNNVMLFLQNAMLNTMIQLDRITHNPSVMGGKPIIRGMRVTVSTVVGLVAAGKTTAEILAATLTSRGLFVKPSPTLPGGQAR
jgi:Protein of unknown function (DUF433)